MLQFPWQRLRGKTSWKFQPIETMPVFSPVRVPSPAGVGSPARVSRISIAAAIVLVLLAMMLPVCHLHPLLDKGAPVHCTICVALHAALPVGVHLPQAVRLQQAGSVVIAAVQTQPQFLSRFAASRAPPSSAI